jgi:hypothetical protein
MNLAEALHLPIESHAIFKDTVSGLEYIRSCRELTEKGLYVELGGYQCHVFLDWRFVSGEPWEKVNRTLAGAGAASIQGMYDEMFTPKPEATKEPVKKKAKTGKTPTKTKSGKPVTKPPSKKKSARKGKVVPGKKKSS